MTKVILNVLILIFLLQGCAILENCTAYSEDAEIKSCTERNEAKSSYPFVYNFYNGASMDAANAASQGAQNATNAIMMMPPAIH